MRRAPALPSLSNVCQERGGEASAEAEDRVLVSPVERIDLNALAWSNPKQRAEVSAFHLLSVT